MKLKTVSDAGRRPKGIVNVVPRIERLVAKRPTYGYRRITALLNRELRAQGLPPVNHKCVYRIMERNSLLLERSGFDRPEPSHDGKVIMMRSTCVGVLMGRSSRVGTAMSSVPPS